MSTEKNKTTGSDEAHADEHKQSLPGRKKDAKDNLGTPPPPDIEDGGVEGEAKQPKEHTGKMTTMGGDTGGDPWLGDAAKKQ